MNKFAKSVLTIVLGLTISWMLIFSSGCSALTKAIAREFMDDGKHATIENKSFARHFKDAFLEEASGIQPTIDKTKK